MHLELAVSEPAPVTLRQRRLALLWFALAVVLASLAAVFSPGL